MANTRKIEQKWADLGQILATFALDIRYKAVAAPVILQIALPAINTGQYAIARRKETLVDDGGALDMPVGAILFARVSLAIDAKFRQAGSVPMLQLDEWDSGPFTWIIHSPGEQQAVGKLLDDVHHKQLGGGKFSAFISKQDGSVSVRDFG